jgi:hypothetical protein
MTLNYSATTITMPGIILPAKNLPNVVHSQNRQVDETGGIHTYNRGVNQWYWEITLRLTEAQKTSLFDFIKNTIVFSLNEITLTPDTGINLGAGVGTAFHCYYWGDELPVAIERSGALFTVSFIVSTSTTGTNIPST